MKTTRPGKSEALSSEVKTRFDLVPREFIERVAKRFALGTNTYPPFNYAAGFADKDYIIDRINHMQAHLTAFLWPTNDDEWEDDHLAAIGWAVAFLMLCEGEVIRDIRNERALISIGHEYTNCKVNS